MSMIMVAPEGSGLGRQMKAVSGSSVYGKVILRNSIFLIGSELLNKGLTVVFFVLLARYLTSSETGVYITLVTFLSVGMFITDPGLSQTLIRNISRDPGKVPTDLARSITLTTLLWLAGWVGMLIAASVLGYPGILKRLLLFGGIALAFQSWAQMASAYLKARQRMEIVAAGNSLGLAIFSSLGIFFLVRGLGLVGLAFLIVLQAVFQFAFFWGAVIRLGLPFPGVKWNLKQAAPFVREVIPIALLGGSGIALNSIDIFMLSQMKGMTDTAHYGLAVKLIDSLSLLSSGVLTAVFPFFSSKWEESGCEVRKAFLYASKFFLVVGMISVAVVMVLSRELVTTLFGAQFTECSRALVVLIWSFLFYMAGAPLGVIIMIDKDRVLGFLPYAVATVAVNIMLNLWLIPIYSYIGASVSTLACSALLYVMKARFVRDFIPPRKELILMSRNPFLAAVGMAAILLLTKSQPLAASLLLGAASFVIILSLLGEFKGGDYAFLDPKRIIPRRN